MDSVIEMENVSFSYPGTDSLILENANLSVERGDFLAIVGNNGCGKSTLCKAINGLIPHFIAGFFSGNVTVDGLNTREADIAQLARKAGYVYQDFENQIVRPSVLDDASYACLNYAVDDYLDKARAALSSCGLTGREDDFIWQLSGGQTHLLALAGVLALNPEVIILDEPIAQLDPMHADRIYRVLRKLNENGRTIIVIEHHSEFIADYCKHVALMKNGHVEWVLPVRQALCHVSELHASSIFPPQITTAAYRLNPECENLPVTVEEGKAFFIPRADRKSVPIRLYERKSKPVVSFKNISVGYRNIKGGQRTVFKNLSFDINEGEKVALIGSNGAGKSTLMKLMIGLIRPSSGSVMINGRDIASVRTERLSREISMVYQNPEDMFIKDSIEKDISYALEVRSVSGWKEKTAALLERFSLTDLKDNDGRLLSGGQMRRASLAIGIALDPGILLLDEPTANLDLATRKGIITMLDELKEVTHTAVIATHDMQLVCDWAERIIILCNGEVVADGSRDEIFSNTRLLEEVGIRPPEIFTMGRILDPGIITYTIDDFLTQVEEKNEAWKETF